VDKGKTTYQSFNIHLKGAGLGFGWIPGRKNMHRVVDQYNAFTLNEYQGTFEVVSGNVDNDDKFWMDWAIASKYDSSAGHSVPVQKDDGSHRNVPIKVVLGNKEEAIANLRWLLGELEGHDLEKPPMGEPDSVPF
jgi:hypothetical protein